MKKALFAALTVAALGTAVSAEILEQVLVKVNGEIVTQTEFHRIQLRRFESCRTRQTRAGCPMRSWPSYSHRSLRRPSSP